MTGQVVWARADNEPPWPAVVQQTLFRLSKSRTSDVEWRLLLKKQRNYIKKSRAWITYNNVFNYEKFKGVFNNDSTNPKLKKAV